MPNDISDVTGEEYGRWSVIDKLNKEKWLAKCKCGVTREVRATFLRTGRSKSCGCLQKEIASKIGKKSVKDLSGMKFGRLTVCERKGSKKRRAIWKCLCECGGYSLVSSGSLLSGKTNSCGCLQKEVVKKRMYNPDITDKERELSKNRDLDPRNSEWRNAVYKRDNYICQACGDDKGGNLVAHHKNGYHWCKEGRYDVNNGVTACNDCHERFHNHYGQRDNTESQWNEFITGVLPIKRIKIEKKEYDISGKKFNHLQVLKRDGIMYRGYIRYLCKCDCGKEIYVSSVALRGGQKSCGCMKGELIRQSKFDDLSSKRFGFLTVKELDKTNFNRKKWICHCDCGNIRSVYRSQLVNGTVTDCQSAKNNNICLLREKV